MHAARPQGGHVGDGGGVLPHPHVHGRRHQHRLVGGQQHGGGEVVGEAGGHAGEQVGGGGRHHDQVGVAGELDMAHFAFVGERKQVGIDAVLAQRLQGERGRELRPACGQHATHGAAFGPQQADQRGHLERRDPSGNDQQDPPAGEAHTRQPVWMAAMPPLRLRTLTRASPASAIMPASVSWSGIMRMLSARYW